MNEWIKKSIELANSKGYLDKLNEIYEFGLEKEREIPKEIIELIKEAYTNRNKLQLIKVLLKLEKFPIDNPYIGFFRANEHALEDNPETVDAIGNILLSMSLDEIIQACKKPKMASRKIGKMFKAWLQTLGYPVLEEKDFEIQSGIVILKGSDKTLKEYANKKLSCKLEKGIDLVLKKNNKFVIGEAKFISAFGGAQNNQFRDALNLIRSNEGNAIRIAILDGVCWLKGSSMYRKLCKTEGIVLSALLLKDFIESL